MAESFHDCLDCGAVFIRVMRERTMSEASRSAAWSWWPNLKGLKVGAIVRIKSPSPQSLSEQELLAEAQYRFAVSKIYAEQIDREILCTALQFAGGRWDKPPTPDEIIAAIEAAGFQITRMRNQCPQRQT
jgi:hypothetical protein